jgi:2,5-furandicarboxylate decarboxylase 1
MDLRPLHRVPHLRHSDPEIGGRNVSRIGPGSQAATHGFLMLHACLRHRRRVSDTRAPNGSLIVGTHPLIGFAGAVVAPFGVDEMTIAGGLLDEPVRMVKCRTVDLEMPADSEIILGMASEETTAEGSFGGRPACAPSDTH